jgi:hypothetical protein
LVTAPLASLTRRLDGFMTETVFDRCDIPGTWARSRGPGALVGVRGRARPRRWVRSRSCRRGAATPRSRSPEQKPHRFDTCRNSGCTRPTHHCIASRRVSRSSSS